MWLFSPLPSANCRVWARSCLIDVRKYVFSVSGTCESVHANRGRWFLWSLIPRGGRSSRYFSTGEISVLGSKVLVWDRSSHCHHVSSLKFPLTKPPLSFCPITLTLKNRITHFACLCARAEGCVYIIKDLPNYFVDWFLMPFEPPL